MEVMLETADTLRALPRGSPLALVANCGLKVEYAARRARGELWMARDRVGERRGRLGKAVEDRRAQRVTRRPRESGFAHFVTKGKPRDSALHSSRLSSD